MIQRRIEADRGHNVAHRTGRVAKISKGGTPKEIGPSQFRIESDRFGLVCYGILIVTKEKAHITSLAPQGSGPRLQPESF